jgi:MFS family permease
VAISYLGVGLVAPLISIVLAEHGANSIIVGLVGTTMFAAFTLASYPLGTLVDRLGAKSVLIGGLVLYGASLLLFAFINTIALFFVVRFVEGIGAAAISVGTETKIGQLSRPHERARRMSFYALSVGVGWALGPMSGALLFQIHPHVPFIASCSFSLLAALAVWLAVPRIGGSSHPAASLWKSFSLPLLIPVSAGAVHGYLMSSLVTLIPLYLQKLDIDETGMGGIITAVIFGTILSQIPIGYAADHFGRRRVLFVSALVVTCVFVVMPLGTHWHTLVITGILLGAFAGTFYPVGLSLIGEIVKPERLGAANALFSLMFGIGSLTGPALSGVAMNRLSYSWLFYLPAILTLAFGIEIFILHYISKSRSEILPESEPAQESVAQQ